MAAVLQLLKPKPPVVRTTGQSDLVQIAKAIRALKKATSREEIWAVHENLVGLVAHLGSRRRLGRKARRLAGGIVFDAERRLGEETCQLKTDKGGRPRKRNCLRRTKSFKTKGEVLASQGIPTHKVYLYESMARIPLARFKVEAAKPDATTASLARLGQQYYEDGRPRAAPPSEEKGPPTPSGQIARAVKYLERAFQKVRPCRESIQVQMRGLLKTGDADLDRWHAPINDAAAWKVLLDALATLRNAVPPSLGAPPLQYVEAVYVEAKDYVYRAVKRGLGTPGCQKLKPERERLTREDEECEHAPRKAPPKKPKVERARL